MSTTTIAAAPPRQVGLASPVRPVWAIRNLIGFLRDKEDTAKVIGFFRAVDGQQPERNFERFCAAPAGREALARKETLADVLTDWEKLRALPEGSLGRAYLHFMESEGITVAGLKAASDEATRTYQQLEPARVKYRDRLRDMHDLWHVVTGYGRKTLGEICLLAFSGGQTRQRGFTSMAWIWALKEQLVHPGRRVISAMREGYRRGAKAEWLVAEDWEDLLALPLDEVRRALNISSPRKYLA